MIAGTVTSYTVLAHPVRIAHLFGWGTLIRCWWAIISDRHTTFLDLCAPAIKPAA